MFYNSGEQGLGSGCFNLNSQGILLIPSFDKSFVPSANLFMQSKYLNRSNVNFSNPNNKILKGS